MTLLNAACLEATGHHRATTHSLSPQRPPGPKAKHRRYKYPYFAGHFNDHGNGPVQYRAYLSMDQTHH